VSGRFCEDEGGCDVAKMKVDVVWPELAGIAQTPMARYGRGVRGVILLNF
jgi:hypothetical protein